MQMLGACLSAYMALIHHVWLLKLLNFDHYLYLTYPPCTQVMTHEQLPCSLKIKAMFG